VLDIDVNWRMHTVSDGQRRRVQICVGLLRPFKVRPATRDMLLAAAGWRRPCAASLPQYFDPVRHLRLQPAAIAKRAASRTRMPPLPALPQQHADAPTLHLDVAGPTPCAFPSLVQVLLLDEITVDLDVLGRADLMRFLADECEQRGASIIYATHIFDGLEFWPTHVAFVARGEREG
jgi:hypothetical protein